MRRSRLSLSGALAAAIVAVGAAPAPAANYDISAKSSPNAFAPSSVTLTQGDTVTWSNSGGTHNVRFDDGSFDMPPDPISDAWSVSHRFDALGTYRFYCEAHGDVGGVGMSGVVVVNAPPGGGGGGGGGGPPGPGPGPADPAPVSSLTSPSKQDIDKLYVRASMNEAGTLAATATVSVPGGSAMVYRFKRVSRSVSANQAVKLRLKLQKKSLRKIKRALRHRRKLSAKVTVTARDLTGHATASKQKIRLKR